VVYAPIAYEPTTQFELRATLSRSRLLASRRREPAETRVLTRDYATASDEELMGWLVEGDRRSFEALANRHLDRALRTAARVLGNAADAEEIAQEAMLRVWTRSQSWRPGRAKFTTWLYQIVVNLALDLRRRPSTEPLDRIEEAVDPSASAGAALEERQRQRAVREAIEQMPVRQRAALTLCYYEGLSGQEAAHVLSTSLKGVEGLLLRARRMLKRRLWSQGL